MSRDALPPVPPVIGTPAAYDARTFARTWEERRETWTPPVHPEPLVRARPLTDVEWASGPRDARSLARHARTLGWHVRATFACGWEVDADGELAADTVWELTGEMTAGTDRKKPQPVRRKVSSTPRPPVDSIAVRMGPKAVKFVGIWLHKNGIWASDNGFIVTENGPRVAGIREILTAIKVLAEPTLFDA